MQDFHSGRLLLHTCFIFLIDMSHNIIIRVMSLFHFYSSRYALPRWRILARGRRYAIIAASASLDKRDEPCNGFLIAHDLLPISMADVEPPIAMMALVVSRGRFHRHTKNGLGPFSPHEYTTIEAADVKQATASLLWHDIDRLSRRHDDGCVAARLAGLWHARHMSRATDELVLLIILSNEEIDAKERHYLPATIALTPWQSSHHRRHDLMPVRSSVGKSR